MVALWLVFCALLAFIAFCDLIAEGVRALYYIARGFDKPRESADQDAPPDN